MTAALAVVHADTPLYRLARRPDPWAWPDWSFAGDDGTFGHRYDDPAGQYRVLYASERRGAFVETLAPLRPDPEVLAALAAINADPGAAAASTDADEHGLVPREWLAARRIGTARLEGAFCDIAHSASLAHLRAALSDRLVAYGLEDLDAGDVRRRAPHALTQELSRYVYEHGRDEHDAPLRGIRYLSRLGDELENWAIVEGAAPIDGTSAEIASDDPDLHAALATLGLRLS